MTSPAPLPAPPRSRGPLRQLAGWLDAMPHPSLACEIAPGQVAAARWDHRGAVLQASASEQIPEGSLFPSPTDSNVLKPDELQAALRSVFGQLRAQGENVALLIPDPVIRVFILPFETFPRRQDEAAPLLRWRLKKSVPFDVEETAVSAMRQTGKGGVLEIVAGVARQKIVREYEALVEAAGCAPRVVMSSTLAALPLLEEAGASMLVRLNGRTLTTAIVNQKILCVYRSTEAPAPSGSLEIPAMLEEIYPAVAYYQDTWGASMDRAYLAGLAERTAAFQKALRDELGCPVMPLASAAARSVPAPAQALMDRRLEALVGWNFNRGA